MHDLTQKVTSFKKEKKKKTQRGTRAFNFCYIRRKVFNCLSICFLFFFQQKVCLRYDEKVDTPSLFLHEAEMANVLRHKNMLSIYGVVTGSSYSPTFALVSLTTKSFYFWSLKCRNLAEQRRLKLVKSFWPGFERKRNAKRLKKLFTS